MEGDLHVPLTVDDLILLHIQRTENALRLVVLQHFEVTRRYEELDHRTTRTHRHGQTWFSQASSEGTADDEHLHLQADGVDDVIDC
ncbi:hypothetical protein D3C84_1042020 [compost metagenome]